MRDINNGEGYACGGPASIRVISVHSPQFCCELKIILKKKKLKQSQQNEKINDRHWTPKLTFYKYETFCMILDTLKNKQTNKLYLKTWNWRALSLILMSLGDQHPKENDMTEG